MAARPRSTFGRTADRGRRVELQGETTVAIDGQIHESAHYQPIRDGCEIFFISKLEGG